MSNIRIVNLNSYTTPVVQENNRKQWVEYGESNMYYQYLIDRYNGSATNNAIINGVCELIYGKGIGATDANRRPEQYAQMISMFSKHCLRRVVFDLKAMGQAAFQVIYNDDKTSIAQVEHFPIETLRYEKMNDDGDIEAYWYSKDWSQIRKKGYEPERIPAYGYGATGEKLEIYCIKPYRAGYYYYSPVDYQGALPYAQLEEEVANFHLNSIRSGLSPSMLINFNNGIPSEEERELIERRIIEKFSGTSNAGKFILAFNDNKEMAASIDPVQLSDAAEQYQFLSEESTQKLMVGHRITSPMLLGIKDSSGLGSNADEIKTASLLFQNTVIRSTQEMILDAMDDLLAFNDISLNLYFKTLQPLEFIDYEGLDEETKEEETGRKFSAEEIDLEDFLKQIGEDEPQDEEYELIDVDSESTENEPEDFDVEKYLNGLVNLSAKDDSSQDSDLYKVRYTYVKGTSKTPDGETRNFCKKMLRSEKLYRKEDIGMMSAKGINKKFGHKGKNYSLFKYKGGVNCYHRWERRIYKKKITKNGEPWAGNALQGTKFVNVNQAVRAGFKLPKNPNEVSIAPIDMPRQGHHPNYGK
tara:strand:+ start:3336 stop:5087 length:1752 start_codon:yes stop_codon:yes gene_type:complete